MFIYDYANGSIRLNSYIFFLLGMHTTILTLSTKKLKLVLAAGVKKAQIEMQAVVVKKAEMHPTPNMSGTHENLE
jgi:hypothetical protein